LQAAKCYVLESIGEIFGGGEDGWRVHRDAPVVIHSIESDDVIVDYPVPRRPLRYRMFPNPVARWNRPLTQVLKGEHENLIAGHYAAIIAEVARLNHHSKIGLHFL
jgi:hypothetical protein